MEANLGGDDPGRNCHPGIKARSLLYGAMAPAGKTTR
jgi:hypothetical protein